MGNTSYFVPHFVPSVVFSNQSTRRIRKGFDNIIDCGIYCARLCNRYNRMTGNNIRMLDSMPFVFNFHAFMSADWMPSPVQLSINTPPSAWLNPYINQDVAPNICGDPVMSEQLQRRETLSMLSAIIERIESEKPNDRRDDDRRYAVVITDLEKVAAYYAQWLA